VGVGLRDEFECHGRKENTPAESRDRGRHPFWEAGIQVFSYFP
jgi:hypothetical protein